MSRRVLIVLTVMAGFATLSLAALVASRQPVTRSQQRAPTSVVSRGLPRT